MRGFLICGLIVVATIDSVKSFCTDVSHNECSVSFSILRKYVYAATCEYL